MKYKVKVKLYEGIFLLYYVILISLVIVFLQLYLYTTYEKMLMKYVTVM